PRRAVLLRLRLALLQPLFERLEALPQRGHFFAQPIRVHLGRPVTLGLGAGSEARAGHHAPPPRATHPLLEDALHLALVGDDSLEARLHRALQEVLPGLAVLDELRSEERRVGKELSRG